MHSKAASKPAGSVKSDVSFFAAFPVATDSDCVECDDQQLAYQRGTVIHVPILVRSGRVLVRVTGKHLGKLRDWEMDGLIRRREVLLSTAVELDVAVDRDDASDATE